MVSISPISFKIDSAMTAINASVLAVKPSGLLFAKSRLLWFRAKIVRNRYPWSFP